MAGKEGRVACCDGKRRVGDFASRYAYGELLLIDFLGHDVVGTVTAISWRGDEAESFEGHAWSYDILRLEDRALCRGIPECDVLKSFRAMDNAYPLEGNNCWFCGHDLIAEAGGIDSGSDTGIPATGMAFQGESSRPYKPHGLPLAELDTLVYRCGIYLENYVDAKDGWHIFRVEISKERFKGRTVTWVDEWPFEERTEAVPVPFSRDKVDVSRDMAAMLHETVTVRTVGQDLVSLDGARRFVPYGEPEYAWWVEVAPDGREYPGLWEFWDDEGLAVCMLG